MREFYGLNLQINEHVAELELAKPDTLNAFEEDLHRSFTAALRYLAEEHTIRCILLTAQGRIFSAGGNFDYIEHLASDPANRIETFDDSYNLFCALGELPVPIVAAMHGDAMGLGATIVTACDIIVTHPEARLVDPHVRVGLCAGDGGVASWTVAAGLTRAKRYLLTGDPVSGQQAYEFGLVTDLVDSAEAVGETARGIAQRIAELPPRAVRGTKIAFNALARDIGRTAFELSLAQELRCLETEDLQEALNAAREKRKGRFTGS